MIVILGTAHLSTTPGKCSPDGKFKECVFSREVIKLIKEGLEAKGLTVYVDYESLEPNSQMQSSSAKEEQRKELNWRVNYVNNLCNKYGSSNCIYVSVHVNAAGADGKWKNARGWSVYVSPNSSTKSKKLASTLYEEASNSDLKGNRSVPTEKYWVASLAVCRDTKCPAILTENLFQDNKEDVEFLSSEEGKKQIAQVHINGISNYLNGK
jgi:N-acetylmuramoyl-L-alanine amidase